MAMESAAMATDIIIAALLIKRKRSCNKTKLNFLFLVLIERGMGWASGFEKIRL